jgi:hypothetical protein
VAEVEASAPTEPKSASPRDGFGGETDPIGHARWIEPQTPTRQRPRAIDPNEGVFDPEAAATSPYLPAARGQPFGGPTPARQASTSGDAVKEALAHAQTLGPNAPRLPGIPPVRAPADSAPPPDAPVSWRPDGVPGTPSPGPNMPPAMGGHPMPSPIPGPMGRAPSVSPMPVGRAMSPMPGAGLHPSPLPGQYPHHHHPAPPPAGRSRAKLFLVGGAVLVLVVAVIASIVLAASGG